MVLNLFSVAIDWVILKRNLFLTVQKAGKSQDQGLHLVRAVLLMEILHRIPGWHRGSHDWTGSYPETATFITESLAQ